VRSCGCPATSSGTDRWLVRRPIRRRAPVLRRRWAAPHPCRRTTSVAFAVALLVCRSSGDWACAAPTNTTSRAAAPDATLRIDRPAPADLKCKKPIRLGRFKSRSGAKLRKVGTNSLDTFIADHRAAVRHRPGSSVSRGQGRAVIALFLFAGRPHLIIFAEIV